MSVTVVSYNPGWINEFNKESTLIKEALGVVVEEVHHIGSTSVPGLLAKPIIDMILEVNDITLLDEKTEALVHLGYEAMGELGITGRRYFRKGGDQRTHHIHSFQKGDPHITRHLAFRDYLIAHQELAETYGKLKFQLAQKYPDDWDAYCDGKDNFVAHHEKKALDWYENR